MSLNKAIEAKQAEESQTHQYMLDVFMLEWS